MNMVLRVLSVTVVLAALAACSTKPMGAKGPHSKIRVVITNAGKGCTSRTVPKHHEVILADEDELVWDIRDKDKCLADKDLVIKWVGSNASKCREINTKENGNKSTIKCEIDPNATKGLPAHAYKLYLRDANGDTLLEDPDVEIAM